MRPATLLLPFLMLASVAAAEEPRPRTITTTGIASIFVAPDEATLRFVVQTFDAELPKAKSLNDNAAEEVLAFLKQTQIEAKDIQTASVTSSAVYEYRMEQNRQVRGPIVGYDVMREYSVKLRDLTKLGPIYDKLLPDSRVTLQGHTLTSSESRKHRDQARLDAAKAAREKATALAGALNSSVGAPREISESGDEPVYPYMRQNFVNAAAFQADRGGGSDVSPVGQIEIRAQVTVVFDLAPNAP